MVIAPEPPVFDMAVKIPAVAPTLERLGIWLTSAGGRAPRNAIWSLGKYCSVRSFHTGPAIVRLEKDGTGVWLGDPQSSPQPHIEDRCFGEGIRHYAGENPAIVPSPTLSLFQFRSSRRVQQMPVLQLVLSRNLRLAAIRCMFDDCEESVSRRSCFRSR